MFDQFDYYKDLTNHPFTGERDVDFDARISTEEFLAGFFNGNEDYIQVKNVTRGKVYHIFKVEGFGDGSEWHFINDAGQEDSLADFFFEKKEKEVFFKK